MQVCLQWNVSPKFLVHSSEVFDISSKLNVSHSTETNQFIEGCSMVWRSLSDIAFSGAKQLLVRCREQLGIKDAEFEPKLLHTFKTAKWNQKKYCYFKV